MGIGLAREKKGALIEAFAAGGEIQAAVDGDAISYPASEPMGEDAVGRDEFSQILSTRASDGWRSEDISIPYSPPGEGEQPTEGAEYNFEYRLFSPDLSTAVLQPHDFHGFTLSPEVTERTLYLRNNENDGYVPLVTPENVPSGTKYGGAGDEGETASKVGSNTFMEFLTATPDLSHILFRTPIALTQNAQSGVGVKNTSNLYEWSAGELRLVNILPNNTTTVENHPTVGRSPEDGAHAVSSDGERIAWTQTEGNTENLYVRDMVEEKTGQVGGSEALFQTMSSDGSKIFFLEHGELYEYDFASGAQIDLTANHGANERSAGVKDTVLGASENGSYVYFVASGDLADGAVGGVDNLYLLHENNGDWTTEYVATLSSEDEKNWTGQKSSYTPNPDVVSSRVSSSGQYLEFMSNRSLTGYDNVDALSGRPDEEVYLYDATSDHLGCVSCDPSGGRPIGVPDKFSQESLLVDRNSIWEDHWLAGSISGSRDAGGTEIYQPRNLSNDGRLFFESPDGLVPQATNGLENVYEYEPVGDGSCTSASVTFSEHSDGCVGLISSGISSSESAFFDASENGDDTFFITASKLVSADYDSGYDVYDAHVCSAEAPCSTGTVSAPPCTSGDSCKAAPSPQPEIFGPAPSATFSGTGNVVVEPSTKATKPKSLTQAQKLARALAACRKKKDKAKRAACERQARKLYAARSTRRINTSRKGHG